MIGNAPENKGVLKDFYIHPQSKEDLQTIQNKVQGVPAHYIFHWTCDSYKPNYVLSAKVEAINIQEAETKAKEQIIKRGVPNTDNIILTLIRIDNKKYVSNRNVFHGRNI